MAITTQGTLLKRGKGDTTPGPETFETVGSVQDFSGPNITRGEIDVTTLVSTAKEYMPALKDNGDISFNGLFQGDDLIQQAIISDLNSTAPRHWKLSLSDGTTMTFLAIVKGFPLSGGVDGAVKYQLGLRITGDIAWTFPS